MKLAKNTRVLLVDDQAKVRSALRLLLEQEPDLKVVGETAGVTHLTAQIAELHPDLILLDWELRHTPHNGLMSALRSLFPDVKVVALSARPEARRAALEAGADAFVSKVDGPKALLTTLHDILS
jgi:DNA-binding NarL/FixJ family response regulator